MLQQRRSAQNKPRRETQRIGVQSTRNSSQEALKDLAIPGSECFHGLIGKIKLSLPECRLETLALETVSATGTYVIEPLSHGSPRRIFFLSEKHAVARDFAKHFFCCLLPAQAATHQLLHVSCGLCLAAPDIDRSGRTMWWLA